MRNVAYFFIVGFATVALLILGESVLVPFVFALILWFLTKEIRKGINGISFVNQHFPKWLINVVVFLVMTVTLGVVSNLLASNISELTSSIDKYQPNAQKMIGQLEKYLHVDIINTAKSSLGKFDFGSVLGSVANSLSGILGNVFMIIIYCIFMFLEESSFQTKIKKVFIKKEQYDQVNTLLLKIEASIASYLKLKTYVSLLTGGLSYLVLVLVDVDSAFFWALLIFLLNYIPTIGSLIATVFPAIFSLLQFGEFTPFLIVLIAVGIVQVVVGNFIEPRVFGKSLNLSPLVTLVALAVWGKIWGITGMLLSVPITVIMMIVFSQIEKTRPIAIMLSENGVLEGKKKSK